MTDPGAGPPPDAGAPPGGRRAADWMRAGVLGLLTGITTDFLTGVVGDWVPPTPVTLVIAVVVGFVLVLEQESGDPPGGGTGTTRTGSAGLLRGRWVDRRALRREAAALRRLVRQAKRKTPPIVLVGLDGPREGWWPADAERWFGDHHDELRDRFLDACKLSELGRPGLAVCRPLRRWWFEAARVLCAWYASRPDPGGGHQRWEQVCEAVGATPTGRERGAFERWRMVQLGVIHRLRREHETAIELLTEALPTRGNWADPQIHTNLGLVYLSRGEEGDVDRAIRHLARAQHHRSLWDRAGRAVTDLALARAYLARGGPLEAQRSDAHLRTAATTLRALGKAELADSVDRERTGR